MKMVIEVPEEILPSVSGLARAAGLETGEWIARLVIEVITSNEIHHLRKDVIDWREELLS